ncbi:MAG TPA: 30S ribosomal protein S17 [Desulfobacterales bacterium]|nr:30S ribosomal protein S17 [Desulfobacterales bacterium]
MENKLTRSLRKQRVGVVVSDKMDKTISVEVVRRMRHPKYGKFITRRKKYLAHDENNEAHVGDTVRIMETRPFSRRKRWRLVEIIERAK